MSKIKPCPCCGGAATVMEDYCAKAVQCEKCGLTTPRMAFGWGSFFRTP